MAGASALEFRCHQLFTDSFGCGSLRIEPSRQVWCGGLPLTASSSPCKVSPEESPQIVDSVPSLSCQCCCCERNFRSWPATPAPLCPQAAPDSSKVYIGSLGLHSHILPDPSCRPLVLPQGPDQGRAVTWADPLPTHHTRHSLPWVRAAFVLNPPAGVSPCLPASPREALSLAHYWCSKNVWQAMDGYNTYPLISLLSLFCEFWHLLIFRLMRPGN